MEPHYCHISGSSERICGFDGKPIIYDSREIADQAALQAERRVRQPVEPIAVRDWMARYVQHPDPNPLRPVVESCADLMRRFPDVDGEEVVALLTSLKAKGVE